MPRGFTEEEKARIRRELMDKGAECFVRYGVRKTNVEDITKAVGIAKGSFYLFYNSKEELFMDILEEKESEMRRQADEIIGGISGSPQDKFLGLCRFEFNAIYRDPILRVVLDREEYQQLVRRISMERLEAHIRNDDEFNMRWLSTWVKEGGDLNAKMILVRGILAGLFVIHLHKKEIGEDIFPEVLDKLLEMVAREFIKE